MAGSFTAIQFSGGMNDWIHPSLLNTNVAAKLINAEVDNGKLKPIRQIYPQKISDPVEYGHYGNRDRSVVKWYDRYYWSNNAALAEPFYGGNVENYLGIPYPAYSGENPNVSISTEMPQNEEAGLSGIYKYCVCFVNENGWEGAPGSLDEYEKIISLSSQWASITVTWNNEKVSYAKIYRTGDHGADFYCIGEIRQSGDSIIDKTDDTTLTMLNPLSTEDCYPPPEKGKFLCESGGVFFLAVGSLLYFSVQGNPHAWPTLQFLSFDDTITGIVPEFQGILVFTKNNAFRVVGADSPDTVTKTFLPGNHGCINFRSIACVNNAPVWLSNDGICLWDGNTISIPSYQVLKTDFLQVKYAVSANDRYYLFLVGETIIFDRKNGDIFYRLNFSCDYAWYDPDNDTLYLQINNAVYQYGGGKNLTFEYLSPQIGGTELSYKVFHEILVSAKGDFQISAFVDDLEILNQNLPQGRQRIKMPFSATGRFCQIQIKSNAEINEIALFYQ